MVVWLRSFSSRLPVYIYPLTLVGIEFLLRQLISLETKTFIGPTLASIGVSFLLPLTSKKTLTLEKWKKFPPAIAQKIEDLQNQNVPVQIETAWESNLRTICATLIGILTLIWIWSLYLSIKFPDNVLWTLPVNYYPGLINYFIGLVLSEIREGL